MKFECSVSRTLYRPRLPGTPKPRCTSAGLGAASPSNVAVYLLRARRALLTLAAAAFASLLCGCPVSPKDGSDPDPKDIPRDFEQVDDLFVSLPAPKTGYELRTNDTAYWGPYGYTLWGLKGTEQSPFVGLTVELNKTSGDTSAGFGVVFCHYDTGDPNLGETMLTVMINTEGEYIIGEVIGASFTELTPWTQSPLLVQGYGVKNTIGIGYSGGQFALTINGAFVQNFRDDEAPFHDYGRSGYIVVISPYDSFPQTPVHVTFQEQ
jgi:hypothetical protein